MTRDGTRPLAAFIAAVLAAALLAACGGSDSSSTGSTAAGAGSADSAVNGSAQDSRPAGTPPKSGSQGQSQDQSQSQSGGQGKQSQQSQDQQGNGGGSGSKDVETPLKVSGGGAEQFRVKGGDNSIQEYGDEGDESELQEVAEIVHGFYVARAEEQWDTACSYLAKGNVEQLEQLATQSPQFEGSGCGPILKAFTRPLPAAIQREVTTVDAGSFRHDGDQGFLIYYGADRTAYAMPLRNEGGIWKVTALSGTTIG